MSDGLRIAGSLRPPLLARDSGPGLRWLLFLQGCVRPCTDQCLNPHYLDPRGGRPASLTELRVVAGQVAAGTYGPAEGITLLGGEPTDQAAGLRPFLEAVRSLGLSVMLYSGHPLSWFHRPGNEEAHALLGLVDILVDGPFLPKHAEPGLRWRGSSNQRILRLTSRYSEEDLKRDQERVGVTLTLRGEGLPVISGLQDRKAAEAVERRLGVELPAG
ncbi:MAG TPA: 4Fe-4S single cluster domain-containing protein [Thermoanaerobaculia bacterium]|nr:4Fe-4S single cluster domain-containing protein [Thermoanaerobaculia bacterium]